MLPAMRCAGRLRDRGDISVRRVRCQFITWVLSFSQLGGSLSTPARRRWSRARHTPSGQRLPR